MTLRLSKKAQKEFDKLNKRIKQLESELQDFNIKLKYYLFDIEATQREKAHYKKLYNEGRS